MFIFPKEKKDKNTNKNRKIFFILGKGPDKV